MRICLPNPFLLVGKNNTTVQTEHMKNHDIVFELQFLLYGKIL